MQEFSTSDLTERERARIMKTAVTPRPIAWISSVDSEGNENLAPFSAYNYISSANPVIVFNSPNEDSGGLKDTARNALATGEFAVNVVTEPLLEAMDTTSASLPPTECEFDFADVPRTECQMIDAPRVDNCSVTMECKLYDSIEIHDRISIFGDVVHFHVSESVMTDGEIDMMQLPTVGRLGGPYYTIAKPVEFERQF